MAFGVQLKAARFHQCREALRLAAAQHAPALVFQAQEDVLRHGERWNQLELLVHDRDALGERRERVPRARPLAEDVERAGARRVVAAEDLAER